MLKYKTFSSTKGEQIFGKGSKLKDAYDRFLADSSNTGIHPGVRDVSGRAAESLLDLKKEAVRKLQDKNSTINKLVREKSSLLGKGRTQGALAGLAGAGVIYGAAKGYKAYKNRKRNQEEE